MSTVMDVVFVVDSTSFAAIRAMIIAISTMMLSMSEVRMGLIKVRSISDTWSTRVYEFTQNVNILQQWLNNDEPGEASAERDAAIGDALREALGIGWRVNVDEQVFHEKVVILFTDGAPNGLFTPLVGADPWIMSKMFLDQNITLVIVGAGESFIEYDDFYCALAENTGGLYIPMVNFEHIFSSIVNSVFNEGDTVSQALHHISIEEIEQNSSFTYATFRRRVNKMINGCQSIQDIRQLFFDYGASHVSKRYYCHSPSFDKHSL